MKIYSAAHMKINSCGVNQVVPKVLSMTSCSVQKKVLGKKNKLWKRNVFGRKKFVTKNVLQCYAEGGR